MAFRFATLVVLSLCLKKAQSHFFAYLLSQTVKKPYKVPQSGAGYSSATVPFFVINIMKIISSAPFAGALVSRFVYNLYYVNYKGTKKSCKLGTPSKTLKGLKETSDVFKNIVTKLREELRFVPILFHTELPKICNSSKAFSAPLQKHFSLLFFLIYPLDPAHFAKTYARFAKRTYLLQRAGFRGTFLFNNPDSF